MSSQQPYPAAGSGGKLATAFLAGAVVGALAMTQVVPSTLASSQGSPVAIQDQPGGGAGLQGSGGGDGLQDDGAATAGLQGQGTTTGPSIQDQIDDAVAGLGGASGATQGTTGTSDGTNGTSATATTGTSDGSTTGTTGTTGTTTTTGDASSETSEDTSSEGDSTSSDDGSSASGSNVEFGGGGGGESGSGSNSGRMAGSGCAADNGGATDVGVTATEIKIAATVVDDGRGASLLKPAKTGITTLINQVNKQGGICGRRLVPTFVNDSWDAAKGRDAIKRFIEDGNFALVVVPSSEGLAAAIEAGLISDEGIPVVGTTGLRIDEYQDPWVFPVASATVSIMRSMARHAYEAKGARTFGIVWDNKFKFGIEGATAFKDYIKTLPGTTIKADQPLNPDDSSYSTQAQQFNTQCGNSGSTSECDMVSLLLVPDVAIKWKSANAGISSGRGDLTYGAQTLFTDDFAARCGDWCAGLTVWTGYNPPLPPMNTKAGVKQYFDDVKAENQNIDATNQFVEGAYLGTRIFIEAVAVCSPNLTRACIKQVLDQTDYSSDLANTLSWRPGNHHANKFAQAFAVEASGGSFNGWRYQNTGWIKDPNL